MDQDLQSRLNENAKQWLALSLSISAAEKQAFTRLHDGLLSNYGPEFMTHVYRTTFEQALQQMPEAERVKMLHAFQKSLDQALTERSAAF